MTLQRRPDRPPRRSKRLVLAVRVHVFGLDVFRECFNEFTHMISVNAHGGSLALAARVQEGQRVLVVNQSTREERECRVAYVGTIEDGKWAVGIEFAEPVKNFWKITFPDEVRARGRVREVKLAG
jgi:hypothetical protein